MENNVIVNCARGIGFGMGDSDTGTSVYADAPHGGDLGHIDGIIRNNFIYADIDYFDTGIEIIQAAKPLVVNHTVVAWTGAAFFSSIDYRFGRTHATIQNNLVGRITARDGAGSTVDHDLEGTPASYLVDPQQGDFHLTAAASNAIDQGVAPAKAGPDMDGEPHTRGAPDVGPDERWSQCRSFKARTRRSRATEADRKGGMSTDSQQSRGRETNPRHSRLDLNGLSQPYHGCLSAFP